MKYLSMAALALVGAVMTSCSSDDELLQPANPGKVITLSTTVNLDNGSGTRALTPEGVKTFAVGETMALIYQTTAGVSKKVVSHALEVGDITGSYTSATFTFDLDEAPNKEVAVKYVYPASMADDNGINYAPLSTQDGTFATLAKDFDLAYNTGAWDSGNLPGLTLQNQLAILAIKLKNSDGNSFITNTITEMIVSDGTNTYTVNRTAADGPIYVAIIPTDDATITVTATDGSKYYLKTLSNKTYNTNNVYPVNWLMPEYVFNGKFSVGESKQVVFSPSNLQATTTDNGENWTWAFAAHQWDYVGNNAANNVITGNKTVSTNGTFDLFGWSTPATYFGIQVSHFNSDYSGDFNDWGNVPGIISGWRTLSHAEWDYLFNTRTDAAAKYGYATVNDKHGIIILPDEFTDPMKRDGVLAFRGSSSSFTEWTANVYTSANWAYMEANGAVFLPAAGYRYENGVELVGSWGFYWTSTAAAESEVYSVHFDEGHMYTGTTSARHYGQSVRLVRDVVAP